ncbi:MAG: (d)CMP kinase [Candidatus Dojkabacteria bacterium]|nr:(d)CMP kinase [Candidatus Dojkabacteria bacterium]
MNRKEREGSLGYLFVVGGCGSSGSTTIAKMISEYFSLKRVYGGKIYRDILKSLGYDLEDNFPDKKIDHIDEKVDRKLFDISKDRDILIESKIFAALATKKKIPCTIKIWLNASLHTRTVRRMNRDGLRGLSKYLSIRNHLLKRYRFDKRRFNRLYKIKYNRPKLYNDIVLDTSRMNEEETFNLILKYIKDGGYIKEK